MKKTLAIAIGIFFSFAVAHPALGQDSTSSEFVPLSNIQYLSSLFVNGPHHAFATQKCSACHQGQGDAQSDGVLRRALLRSTVDSNNDNPLGVSVETIPPELAAQMNAKPNGLIVFAVDPSSPAEKAGIQRYDILLRLNDQELKSPTELKEIVTTQAGKEAPLLLRRGGSDKWIVASLPELTTRVKADYVFTLGTEQAPKRYIIGVSLAPVDEVLRSHLLLDADRGVLITTVTDSSPAAKVGIEKNDILLEIDSKVVGTEDQVRELIQASGEKELAIKLIRKGKSIDVKVTPQLAMGQDSIPLWLPNEIAWDHAHPRGDKRMLSTLDLVARKEATESESHDLRLQLNELKDAIQQLSEKVQRLTSEKGKD